MSRLIPGPGRQGRQALTGRLVPGPEIRSRPGLMPPVNQRAGAVVPGAGQPRRSPSMLRSSSMSRGRAAAEGHGA